MNWLEKQRVKGKLKKAFRAAEITIKTKVNKEERHIYPKVVSVEGLKDRLQVVFYLLNGTDPKKLTKNEVCFKQIFGKNAEIETDDIKKCVLNVYKESMPKEVKYDYNKIYELIEGMKLPIVCGVDRRGQYEVFDAVENGEMNGLISGEPGAGKSTQLRQIITTWIKYLPPERLELYLADLKLTEFHIFSRVAHLKSPICENVAQLRTVVAKIKKEMTTRGKLIKKYEVSHVDELPESERLPYVALFIDEVVMLQGEDDIIKDLVQIVSLGRALGIFTSFSLQRPSFDILDTKIRALLSFRMGFRTADLKNSNIIGTPGSEKISQENRGRFILKRESLQELQAPHLTLEKAKQLIKTFKVEKPVYEEEKEHEPKPQEQQQEDDNDLFGGLDNGIK